MSKKIIIKIGIMLTITLIIVSSIVWLYFHNEKKETINKIEEYLTTSDYQSNIKEQEILYDFKIGEYYGKLVFKDEPENYYEVYILGGKVEFTAYNKENEEITNPEKARHINNQ